MSLIRRRHERRLARDLRALQCRLDLAAERARMIRDGELVEIKTAFGSLWVVKSKFGAKDAVYVRDEGA